MRLAFSATILSILPFVAAQDPSSVDRSQVATVRVGANQAVVEPGVTLLHLVERLAPLAKRNVLLKREVSPKLEATRLVLTEPLTIPLARVTEVLEGLLFSHDFIFVSPTSEGQPWQVLDLKGPERNSIRNSARVIDASEIPAYAGRSVLVSAVIPVQHTSARDISASLRPFFPDNQLETVTNIGNSNALLVTGFGPTVNSVARLIKSVDTAPNEEGQSPAGAAPSAAMREVLERLDALEKRVGIEREKPPQKK